MPEKHNFGVAPVTCHSFNGNQTELALSVNNQDVKLFKKNGSEWESSAVLSQHGQRVTGIAWAAKSNRIVTCGADRNAYVWTFIDGKWKPALVLLRINRAATCVKWSPNENKFAVGSGARLVSICYFEEENNWWVSKHIKRPIRSTVTSIDWHPNNILITCGSTDFKARIFSAYIKEVESKPSPTNWGTKMTFGNLMAEYSNGGGGWVHSVAFSPSGDKLAWVGHDASVSVVNAANGQQLSVVKGNFLPYKSMIWVTENSLVAGGFSCVPTLFSQDNSGKLSMISVLDIPQEKAAGTQNAMNLFKARDATGTSEASSPDLQTQHKNTITQVCVHTGTSANCSKFSTSGVDGNLIIWDFQSIERAVAGLKIA